jgi:hypothetical protein
LSGNVFELSRLAAAVLVLGWWLCSIDQVIANDAPHKTLVSLDPVEEKK